MRVVVVVVVVPVPSERTGRVLVNVEQQMVIPAC